MPLSYTNTRAVHRFFGNHLITTSAATHDVTRFGKQQGGENDADHHQGNFNSVHSFCYWITKSYVLVRPWPRRQLPR